VANYYNNSVTEFSATTGALVRLISSIYDLPGPAAISSDGVHVWVTCSDGNFATELSATTGAVVRFISSPSYHFDDTFGLASDGTHVWVANYYNNSVTEFSATTGALLKVIFGSYALLGDTLIAGSALYSLNGRYRLVMQKSDGNLVLYNSDNRPLWESHTYPNPGARAAMQTGGDFVIYSASGRALWETHTEENRDAEAVLQRDGNFVIYSTAGKALWSTGT
jgi:DNA-binding beta-propeller fold protein YncE